MILGKSSDKRRAKAAAYPFVPQAGAFPTPRCLGHQRAVQPRGAGRESLSKRGSFVKAVSETLLAPPGRKTGITKKQPPYWATAFSVGENLFSRAVTSQVSSAPASLTSVFGMGTGGPSRQSTPTILFCRLSRRLNNNTTAFFKLQALFSKKFKNLLKHKI